MEPSEKKEAGEANQLFSSDVFEKERHYLPDDILEKENPFIIKKKAGEGSPFAFNSEARIFNPFAFNSEARVFNNPFVINNKGREGNPFLINKEAKEGNNSVTNKEAKEGNNSATNKEAKEGNNSVINNEAREFNPFIINKEAKEGNNYEAREFNIFSINREEKDGNNPAINKEAKAEDKNKKNLKKIKGKEKADFKCAVCTKDHLYTFTNIKQHYSKTHKKPLFYSKVAKYVENAKAIKDAIIENEEIEEFLGEIHDNGEEIIKSYLEMKEYMKTLKKE